MTGRCAANYDTAMLVVVPCRFPHCQCRLTAKIFVFGCVQRSHGEARLIYVTEYLWAMLLGRVIRWISSLLRQALDLAFSRHYWHGTCL